MDTIQPRNTVGNVQSTNLPDGNVVLKNVTTKDTIGSFYYYPTDVKKNKKFIKRIEATIRRSEEYSNYLGYLHQEMNLNNDVIFGNISADKAKLEFHHYPFTLYDIVEIVVNKHIKKHDKFNSFQVSEEILRLHFQNKIGLALVAKTTHDLMHAGKLYIPMESVFGDVNSFVDEYRDYLFQDQIDKFNQLVTYDPDGDDKLPELDSTIDRIEMTKVLEELPSKNAGSDLEKEILSERSKPDNNPSEDNDNPNPFAASQMSEEDLEDLFG